MTFAEISDRTIAEACRGIRLVADVSADERPEDAEEYYDRQLVGLAAVVDERVIGTVRAVLHLPAQDVLEISTDTGLRLVPFVTEIVPEIDLERGRLTINPIAGLLEDADDPEAADADPSGDPEDAPAASTKDRP